MNSLTRFLGLMAALVAATATAAETPAPPPAAGERVGLYDSRVVAYAHFWSEARTREREALVARAREAKKGGDPATQKSLESEIRAMQDRSHLQVFSSAPATEALATLAPRLEALQRELGVARLISKWDETALRDVATETRVDVTDRLVAEFLVPNGRQQKTIAAMKTSQPLPLAKAQALLAAGKL